MQKKYILAPGPTPVPESVTAAFAQPILHHRTPEFEAIFKRVREGLKWLYQTEAEVLTLAATGTGAMEASVINLFSPGDEVIAVNAGKFGERWTKIARQYGLKPIEILVERGQTLKLMDLEAKLKAHPGAKAVLFQASETSTGAKLPTREICALTAKAGMLSVCDAITACGVFPLPMDEWGIDVLITGSQKALMIPPGLAFIALSRRAWKAAESAKLPRFYFDLQKELQAQLKNQTAWTPGISLIQGLDESLRLMREEGLESIFKRHALLAEATREGVKALGLEILSKQAPSESCTAVQVPATIADGKQIVKILRQKHGITIAGGQDELEGKIFRLSHFGYVGVFDVIIGLSALELTLKELGHPVTFGQSVGVALKVFSEGKR